jgi:hypothetical protein
MKLLVVAAMILTVWSPQTHCQQKVGTASPTFLNIVSSTRANGMGACAIDLVNEESALYNPGGVGLYHLSRTIAFAWPQSTKWLPTFTDDLRLKSYTISAGMSSQRLHWGEDPLLNVSLAFAYSLLELDYRPPSMDYTSSERRLNDRADCYTAALGVDYLIRVGIGYTYKRITEDITDPYYYNSSFKANGEDVGITVELPLWRVWRSKHPKELLEPPPAVQITPRYTYVIANGAQGRDLLPQKYRKGLSLHAKCVKTGCSVVDMTLVGEIEEPHLGEGRILKGGVELGLMEICFLRIGEFKDDPMESYGIDINTFGLGFSLNGLIKYTRIIEHVRPSQTRLRWLLANLDVRFDYARYGGEKNQALYNTRFYKLTVSL